jgi:hypothetical protein
VAYTHNASNKNLCCKTRKRLYSREFDVVDSLSDAFYLLLIGKNLIGEVTFALDFCHFQVGEYEESFTKRRIGWFDIIKYPKV